MVKKKKTFITIMLEVFVIKKIMLEIFIDLLNNNVQVI